MLNITQAYQVALISSSHTSEEDARRFMIASNERIGFHKLSTVALSTPGYRTMTGKMSCVDMVYPRARLRTFRKYLM